jgi:hypothetical protein
MRRTPGDGGAGQLYYSESLIAALRTWLGLKVRIRREEISISSPVWGLRPRRVALSLTTKFPKPAILIFHNIKNHFDDLCGFFFRETGLEIHIFDKIRLSHIYQPPKFDIYPNFQVFISQQENSKQLIS